MSRHWIAVRQESLQEGKDTAKAITEIAAKNPALAKRLGKLNWAELRAHIIKQALEDTAAFFKIELTQTFETKNNNYGETLERPKGAIVGILQTDSQRLGVSIEDGKASMFSTSFEHGWSGKSAQQQAWQAHFEDRRQARTLEAMAKILDQKAQCKTDADQTLTISLLVNEVVS